MIVPYSVELLAKTAYRAYGQVTDFKNYQGNPMPQWEELPEKIREAWIAVVRSQPSYIVLEPRELSQVHHAKEYAKNHSEAGVPGHSQFMLIARLARALNL